MSMICKSIQEKLHRLVACELSNEERDLVKSHLAECRDCSDLYSRIKEKAEQAASDSADEALAATKSAMASRFDMAEARRQREREMLSGGTVKFTAEEVAEAPLEPSLVRDDRGDLQTVGIIKRFFTPHPAWRWATAIGSTLAVCILVVLILDRDPKMVDTSRHLGLDPEAGDQVRRAPVSVQQMEPPSPDLKVVETYDKEKATDSHVFDSIEQIDAAASPAGGAAADEAGQVDGSVPAEAELTVGLNEVPATVDVDIAAKEVTDEDVADTEITVEGVISPPVSAKTETIESLKLEAPSQIAAGKKLGYQEAAIQPSDSEARQAVVDQLIPLIGDDEGALAMESTNQFIYALELAEEDLPAKDDASENTWLSYSTSDPEPAPEAKSEAKPRRRSQASSQASSEDTGSWGDIKSLTDRPSATDNGQYWLAIGNGWFLLSEDETDEVDEATLRYYQEKALFAYNQVTGLSSSEMARIKRRITYLNMIDR